MLVPLAVRSVLSLHMQGRLGEQQETATQACSLLRTVRCVLTLVMSAGA